MVPMTVTKMLIVETQRVHLLVVANMDSQEMDVNAQVINSYFLFSLPIKGTCISLPTEGGKKRNQQFLQLEAVGNSVFCSYLNVLKTLKGR